MASKKRKMDKKRKKSIDEGIKNIYSKVYARIKSGQDPLLAEWQATLEIYLFMVQEHQFENPGQLLPMQIDGQDEWDFYLDSQEKLDLPPETCAVLVTPSAFKSISISKSKALNTAKSRRLNKTGTAAWERNAYWILISDCHDHKKIIQVALPGIKSVGIDVLEDGQHFADYTYNTIEDCLNDLSNVTWIFFRPRGQWSKDQIIRYTENWHGKSIYGLNMEDVMFHTEFSYIHHPELLKMTPLESVFKVIQATIPREYDSLKKAIEITNDLNRDMNLGEAIVTKKGILQDNLAQCKALIGRIAVEIDMNLDRLEDLEGVKMPERGLKNTEYNRFFDETAKRTYEEITGRKCPKSIKVM